MQPTAAALTKARVRLGSEAMEGLLETSFGASVAGPDEAPWGYFHGLRKLAIDGFCMNVPKTPENVEAFGMPSNGSGPVGYPQVRVVALAETGTRCLQGVALGALGEGEGELGPEAVAAARAHGCGGR
jgi:hypothetical protein